MKIAEAVDFWIRAHFERHCRALYGAKSPNVDKAEPAVMWSISFDDSELVLINRRVLWWTAQIFLDLLEIMESEARLVLRKEVLNTCSFRCNAPVKFDVKHFNLRARNKELIGTHAKIWKLNVEEGLKLLFG